MDKMAPYMQLQLTGMGVALRPGGPGRPGFCSRKENVCLN